MEGGFSLVIFLALLATGFLAGKIAEVRHYKSITRREKQFLALPATSVKTPANSATYREAKLVTGSVVVSVDYFKRFVAGVRKLIGGPLGSYESLIDRARREAILRMKEAAGDADIIVNTRLDTSAIGGSASSRYHSLGSIEILAYGTAIWFEDRSVTDDRTQRRML